MKLAKVYFQDRNGVKYADQFLLVPLTAGSNERIDAVKQPPFLAVVPMDGATFQKEFPYPLTPL